MTPWRTGPLSEQLIASEAATVAYYSEMRELGCVPTADSYAAVIDASYRAGKPERVPGLLALMAEEGLSPSAAVWELQLRASRGDGRAAALLGRLVEVQEEASSGIGATCTVTACVHVLLVNRC
eukprot:XP_001696706.1 predicted protein [Chlamydomonas reinhardtii]